MIAKINDIRKISKKHFRNCELPITNCELLIADCSMPIAICELPIPNRELLIADCKLLIAYCRLPIAYCLLLIANCRLRIVNCPLPIAYCLLSIAICLYSNNISSQVLPLDTILSRIEIYNPMLKMYDEQINAVNNYALGAKSWMPPTVSTGPWQVPYKSFVDGMWMVTGEQMIPNPSKQKANYNYMKGMAPVELQGKLAKRNLMFAMAKRNYYEWVVLQKKYNVQVQTDSLLNYILQVAHVRYTYNKEKLSNIYKAQADLFELRNMETMLLNDMKMKNVELNTLMNLDKFSQFNVDTTLAIHNYEIQLTETSILSKSRSDIRQFDENINLLKLQQEYEKSKRLPEFGISVSHMQSLGTVPNQFSAMGMMTIPIASWASKEYKSNIKAIDNSVNALSYQKQALINETAGMIASLQTQIKSAKQQLNNFKENIIPSYYNSYQTAMLAYEQNTEDLFVVLDGIKMYRMARMNELEQLNILLKLEVEFEKEMEIR